MGLARSSKFPWVVLQPYPSHRCGDRLPSDTHTAASWFRNRVDCEIAPRAEAWAGIPSDLDLGLAPTDIRDRSHTNEEELDSNPWSDQAAISGRSHIASSLRLEKRERETIRSDDDVIPLIGLIIMDM